jgi:hypothetical protein
VPLVPAVAFCPDVPEVPSPPDAPARFTCQTEYEPPPTTSTGVPYVNKPFPEL